MNRRLLVPLILALGIVSTWIAAAAESDDGFKLLTNGKDLSGWDGNPALWSFKDGAIVGETTKAHPITGNTFLIWTNGTVGDFELRCLYRITANNTQGFANSGIQYRSKVLDPKGWVVGGYQADMEAGVVYTGILYEERFRGIMAVRAEKVVWDKDCKKETTGSLGSSSAIQATIKSNDWNAYVIIAKGNHLQHFVNGKQTVDVTDDCEAKRAMTGVLALQLHAGPAMKVEFKDVRLKTLSGGESAANGPLGKIQGDWQVTSIEMNGEPLDRDTVSSMVVSIHESSYKLTGGERDDHGTFTLDAQSSPYKMDITPEQGPDSGEKLPAIFEVNGDKMRVCYGRGDNRPKAFETSSGSETLLINYTRKAK
jgi:uncharacterized protein (TIGR03067 family)